MASNDDTTTPDPTQPVGPGTDLGAAEAPAAATAEAAPAPRKRSTRSLESRQAAAKKAAATRARKKAEAAARLAAEQAEADGTSDAEGAAVTAASARPDEPVVDGATSPAAEVVSAPVSAPSDDAFTPAAPESTGLVDDGPSDAYDGGDPLTDPMADPVVRAARARGHETGEVRPVVPSFGLLFQAPEPEEVLKDRLDDEDEDEDDEDETDVVEEEVADDAEADDNDGDDHSDDTDDDEGSRGSRRSRRGRHRRNRGGDRPNDGGRGDDSDDQGRDDSDDSDDDSGDSDDSTDYRDDDSEGGRRRRRRGGRGRRRSSRGGDDSGEGSDGRGDSDDSGDDSDDDDKGSSSPGRSDSGDQGEGEPTGRRRRRRRRSGSGGDSDDPPGTVTRVREPRGAATGIKGSTRLEAKRQRRREGREAGRRRTIITEAEFLARREAVERVMVVRERGHHTQIGVLEDGILVEHYISGGRSAQGAAGEPGASMAGNVYLGRVQNVLPSMEAAFVDIGRGRNAVLYAGEVNWDAAGLEQHKARRIENALSNGQSVLVQVTKDPIGHKGARLTSQVSLPGRYLVYVPDGSMTGISRKLPDTERARLKKILKQIVPDDAGVIVRTAAEGASEAELTADVERLQRAWEKIQKKAKTGNAPVLLHGEADLTTRVVRDVFNEDFTKLVVSGEVAWESISDYVESVAPDLADRLERWTGEKDVFAEYRVDEQIAKAMDRKVWLPSGGSLVIDRTEAMTVIDVNTGKFTGSGGNLEETVTKNNIEAAEEIVRQLRLRDIGGIVVVDFIDMVLEANRELVVRRLVECLGRDRTKHQVAEVTSLGLVQMTRKRVGAGLIEVFSEECEHCHGRGILVSTEPLEKSGDSGRGDDRGRGRGGRGRREGKGSGGHSRDHSSSSSSSSSSNSSGNSSSQASMSGPTPAQIAAVAYAAAVQSHEEGGSEALDGDAPMETAAVEAIVAEHLEGAETTEASVPTSDEVRSGSEPTGNAPTGRRSRGSRRASSPSTAPAAPVVEPGTSGDDASTDVTGRVSGAVTGKVTGKASGMARTAPVEDRDTDASDGTGHSGDEAAAGGESPAETAAAVSATETPAPKRRRGARRAASAPTAAPSGAAPAVFTAEEAAKATEALAASAPKTIPAAAAAPSSETPAAESPAAEAPAPTRRRAVRRAAGAPAGPPRPVEGE
ncbi:Rne/Rng family ribonuclease [Mobilicoccus pelagius]|uniref:Ribonuclease E n=1 Tax=Mobilicoccus pelagius NBRC 104925 TaxID=1089455 RepID=H5UQK2_9MICO|nr:Rne/Rng family ribonuclease [Mobilicoccus pelagius]GAB48010.1 hypothetical protein MOPEL_032_00520 [Mobilicoccus pelagius NBRC 104925]